MTETSVAVLVAKQLRNLADLDDHDLIRLARTGQLSMVLREHADVLSRNGFTTGS